jgi:glutamine amidotransferase
MTVVFTDGESLFGLRYASDNHSPTLYVSDTQPGGGRIMASEPLCGDVSGWQKVPADTLCTVAADGQLSFVPLWDPARLSA